VADVVLKIGDRNIGVSAAQQLLIEAGEQIDQSELLQSFFGPSTKTAVLDFQTSHLDAKGGHLTPDGIIGPITKAALVSPRLPTDVFIAKGWRGEPTKAPNQEAMTAALVSIGQIGVKEDPDGSNRGGMVDQYEGPDYLGAPWCACFVSWCWAKTPSGSPFGMKASALKLRDWGATSGTLLPSNEVILPGDIAIILRAAGRGHVGLVVSDEFDGKISLMEGNCANAVRATLRDRSFWSHFVRPRRQ
jgi:hypothetical protein